MKDEVLHLTYIYIYIDTKIWICISMTEATPF